ncbi:MAG: Glucosamine/fructose-6-phosphate aminotransferase, isomerizing [Candidatus Beckwithbacteria bacterium GW2011_GWC2_47_9]|uniref:Glutamine--fructose-6-phosphate aminotransferase [isomerizing] n=3 Tax=Candidatus Beckwithiibacteriota TaxID=1752726 RepID=A0A0G1U059_9BACT|nr:MAG: Glucosamine/fructose-6-phosphate aminotransferase, isomerizing [Candidatus Beckwithbacteria bacterium GW2011_GWC2_47_9]OGD56457.1 MAG: glutamine--fructose-6-phosphate transaminase (isomerizing) [Candidatus Beckwithbacteria bacterium RIFCSPHIGHO2_12_FULL_47_17]OGD61800.1 MAG: glutamine--fructose-6-phosphate transaminase (isomerizing) [Candidatus Beckwithbacteria bacterium RIFCSPLOWO2_02_FULL_47_23]
MCGIFGVVGKKPNAAEVVLGGLTKLEYRGYDSWGIAVSAKGRLVRERHVGKIGGAKTKLPPATIGLGHTRWATHGGVTEGNAHPHFDCHDRLCLVHNGIVENFLELKQKLKGHRFLSETDTEVAVHLFEDQGLLQGFKKIIGMNAFILLDSTNDQLLAVKSGSPLIIGLGKEANYIASDVWALLDHTNKVIFMEDGQAATITQAGAEVVDAGSGRKIKPKIVTLNWQKEQSRLGKFHHYMEKEIYDQPKVLDNLSRLSLPPLKLNGKTFILGCGTASYAAAFADYLFDLSGVDVEAVVGSEFGKYEKLLKSSQTMILFSQSGETIDVVEAVALAKAKGLKIIGITNVLGSTLYRKSDVKILLSAGQEVAVASTKAFTAMLAVGLLLAKKPLGQTTQAVRRLLNGPARKKVKQLATTLKDSEHIFVVGRGLSFPIALEAALKIKEVSYIHAEAYAAGELKHGPIALIEKGTPCLVFGDCVNSAYEMKARGGLIIGIGPKPDKVFDVYLSVADLAEATAIPMVVIAQLLAYDLAVARGLNPDKPRNLAKSVTVK